MSQRFRIPSLRRHATRSRLTAVALFLAGLGIGGCCGLLLADRPAVSAIAASAPASTAEERAPPPAVGRYAADVVRVIDGDTFEARVHVWPGFELTTRVRLRGIDAPELRARCADERTRAESARDGLRAILADRDVTIASVGPDKYFGRIVADVATRRTPDVSAALRDQGLARRYGGGRREGWCEAKASD